MSIVNPTQVPPSSEITASSVNTPVNELAAVINGQIDDSNISSMSASKIADGTIATSKLDDGAATPEKRTVRAAIAGRNSWSLANATNATSTLSSVSHDPESWVSGSRITVPEDGLYELNAFTIFGNGTGDLRYIFLKINGSIVRQFRNSVAFDDSFEHVVTASMKRVLSAGDYVEMDVYQNSGSSKIVSTELCVEFLGRTVL